MEHSKLTPIKITPIPLDDVHKDNKVRFNTNNHWKDGMRPNDYDEVLERCNTENWVHDFHEVPESRILTINEPDLQWMREAEKIGMITNEFTKLYQEELDEFCEITERERPDFIAELSKGNWFVRTNRVSLKNGVHGTGPYSDLKSIVQSMVTGVSGHTGIGNATGKVDIFLLPFLTNLSAEKEFRVFVKDKKITAISIQHLYSRNDWMEGMDDDDRTKIVRRILDFHEHTLCKILELSDYTYDLALLADDTFYFIEPNCFGTEYAAGSSLFGWIQDRDVLYDSSSIEFRYPVD